MLFRSLLQQAKNKVTAELIAKELAEKPVSYTHLDVYKRQVQDFLSRKGKVLPAKIKKELGIQF